MRLSLILEEVIAPHRDFGVAISSTHGGEGPEPVAGRNPALTYGLGNLVDNAVDFAKSEVRLAAEWTQAAVTVTIADDGPGFSADVIDRVGEPYVTTRRLDTEPSDGHGGLGLGIFIAKTLLERSGARLRVVNRKAPESGAIVTVEWPRGQFERDARQMPETTVIGEPESLIAGA
jgi:two-component system sensor histidine kinase RegB